MRAEPAVSAAAFMLEEQSGDVTATSKAVGWPFQLVMKMSPGLLLEPLTMFLASMIVLTPVSFANSPIENVRTQRWILKI